MILPPARVSLAMKTMKLLAHAALFLCLPAGFAADLPLSQSDLSKMQTGWGKPGAGKSVEGKPLNIGGKSYADGVGTHADSFFTLSLDGKAESFRAVVGVDDETNQQGSVEFVVLADGREVFRSGVIKGGQSARPVQVPLAGVRRLDLQVTDGDDGMTFDHADWADARITYSGAVPQAVVTPEEKEEALILTPKPGPKPHLTGARIFGARPGNPFLHHITATGDKPVDFKADGLPGGITLDSRTGMLTGSLQARGEWDVTVHATNAKGSDTRTLKIVGGDLISLTPPMGWNSWNCFAGAVTDKHIRDAARVMAESSLIDHGWTYINIDDFWQVKPDSKDPTLQGPERDASGRILPNSRFPDMKSLTSYIHSLGLKAGVYSSPGPFTCGGCSGSFGHEEQDAAAYAEWGFDYLKHDWCSYKPELEGGRAKPVPRPALIDAITDDAKLKLMLPYAMMRGALDQQKRDIHFSLCQYGWGNVSEWGDKVGGNSWRTTGDITDTWGSMSKIGFAQSNLAEFAKPGRWNDPDMLVVGHVGWGPALHPTRLTPNEQYTHISLWCLLSAPLLIGCDLTKLDDFTLNLLTNDEVLEVNQDPLGKQAARITSVTGTEVWAKQMSDGSWAVGLFNRGAVSAPVTLRLDSLGVSGTARVRDLWKQEDLAPATGTVVRAIPRHGCALIRVWK
jgi:alpha-galactosidase